MSRNVNYMRHFRRQGTHCRNRTRHDIIIDMLIITMSECYKELEMMTR